MFQSLSQVEHQEERAQIAFKSQIMKCLKDIVQENENLNFYCSNEIKDSGSPFIKFIKEVRGFTEGNFKYFLLYKCRNTSRKCSYLQY